MREGWKVEPLGKVCRIIGGGTPSKANNSFYVGDIPWATVRDMKVEALAKTEYLISNEAVTQSSTNIIPRNNIIIATRVGLGKVCLLAQDTAINQDLRGVIPKDPQNLDVRFLLRWFQSIAKTIEDEGTGLTVKGVKLPFVKSLQLPLPPPSEQKCIVAILDEAFEGIGRAVANAEKNLANARELFERTLNNNIFPSSTQTSWQETTVADVALAEKGSIRTGPFGSQLLHSEFVEEGVSVLGIDNAVENRFRWGKKRFITWEKFQELSRYQVKPGDVLITIMGTCGRCAIVPDDIPIAINTKHLCCISLDTSRCLPAFLHAYFLHHSLARKFLADRAKGAIMAGLNMGIIKELPLLLPSLPEQKYIVSRIKKLSAETQRLQTIYQQKLTALAELKQSLLQKAFTGELTAKPETTLKHEAVA